MTRSKSDSSEHHSYGLLDSIMSNPELRDRLEQMPTDEKTVTLTLPDAADFAHPEWEEDSSDSHLSETVNPTTEKVPLVDVGFVPTRHVTDMGEALLDHVDYRIVGQLGKGGTGVVYQAHQRAVDREVAIKVLRDDVAQSELSRTRFLTEARVIGGLDHPNVISIHELSTDQQGRLFYSMKRIDGTSWDQRIDKIPENENIDILLRVSNAIHYAHSRGLIHRDIKPENVMLGQFGEVLLADWGLAISHGANETAIAIGMTIGGTPAYMAPELAAGDQRLIGYPSDIYRLGAILYQILTGQTPHHGVSLLHCIRAAADNEIRDTDVTGELMDIAMKAMETDPKDRFQRVTEFTDAIRDQRQHDQSTRLVRRAAERLERATDANQYEDFRVSDALLREALDVWPQNERATRLTFELQTRYAKLATEHGDLDLALSILQAAGLDESEQANQVRDAIRLRKSGEQKVSRFNTLFMESPEAGMLLKMPGGLVVEANNAFVDLFGYDEDQIVGHQIGELNLWAFPERRHELVEAVREHGVIENFETTFLDIDGNAIEVLLSSRLVKLDGETMVVSTIRDISLLKHAEQELRRSQKRLRELQRLAGMASWQYNVADEKVTWSEEVFGLLGRDESEGAPTGSEFLELIHPDDREPLTNTIDSISPTGASYELIVRLRTPSGGYRRLLFRGKPILDDAGELVEVYGVMVPQK
jgi:PAS domain S-box-containing protein